MAAKPLSAEKLKHYEKIILEELKESVAYLEDTHKTKAREPRKAAATSHPMPITRLTRGRIPT